MAGTYPGWSQGYCPGFLAQTSGSLAQVFETSVGFIRTFPPKSCRQNTPPSTLPAGPGSPWAPTQISCRCSGTGYEMCALALYRSSLAATDACTAEIWGMMFTRASWHFSLICKPRFNRCNTAEIARILQITAPCAFISACVRPVSRTIAAHACTVPAVVQTTP